MNNEMVEFSDRTLAVMLVIMIILWIITLSVFSFVFHFSMEAQIVSAFAGSLFICTVMGFTIYKQRFRDERTVRLLERAGRNGFAFMTYLIPFAIIIYSLTETTHDVALVLAIFWLSSVAVAILSAVYYYLE